MSSITFMKFDLNENVKQLIVTSSEQTNKNETETFYAFDEVKMYELIKASIQVNQLSNITDMANQLVSDAITEKMYKSKRRGYTYSRSLIQKVGAMVTPIIPSEAKNSMERVKTELIKETANNIKELGILTAAASVFTSVFNISMVYILVIMLLFAFADWVVGIIPKPKKGLHVQETNDHAFLDRLHMFLYLMALYLVLSFMQVLMIIFLSITEFEPVQYLADNFPTAFDLVVSSIGLSKLSALGISLYYLNRVRRYIWAIFKMPEQHQETSPPPSA
jgi:hypothetical protein